MNKTCMKLMITGLLMASIAMLAGCGSGTGGAALFYMSMVNPPSLDKTLVEADIIGWTTTACNPPSTTPASDTVNMTVAATATGGTATSPLTINSISVTYRPANASTPALSPIYQAITQTINAGGSVTIPVVVASQQQKIDFQNAGVLPCSQTIYQYYATITVNITEVGTGKSENVSTNLNVYFADFVDK